MLRKKMFLLVMLILTLNVFAGEYSVINSFREEIYPDGFDARIEVEIVGETSSEGVLYLPFDREEIVEKLTVEKGTLVKGEVVEVEVGNLEFTGVRFEEKDEEVKLNLTLIKEDFYLGGKSKQKGSYPNGLKTVKFALKNTTPSDIEKYSVKVFIPEGIELYNMITPSKTSQFDLGIEEGLKYVEVDSKVIKAQSSVKIEFNTLKRDPKAKLIVMLLTIGFSAFFLFKRRKEWR